MNFVPRESSGFNATREEGEMMTRLTRRSFLGHSAVLAAGGAGLGSAVAAAAECPLEAIGKVRPRPAAGIAASPLGVGFETLDRKMFDPERMYPHLAGLGAKWARVQTGWCRCEPVKGQYDFAWLDAVVDRLRAMAVQPWFNLGYGNRLYTPEATNDFAVGWAPLWNDESLRGWLRFVRTLGEHFRDRVKHWEIWNEPNHKNFWKPRPPDAAEYVQFVRHTAPVVRQAVPSAAIIGPAVWGLGYFKACFEHGLGELVDIVSYHWYRPSPEDNYEASVTACRKVLSEHGLKQPLWQGESGCPSQPGGAGALATIDWNEQRQAHWVARRTLCDLRLRVDMTSYFHAVDMLYPNEDGTPDGRLNSKGLVRRSDYTPKPAYFAYQCLCALFDAETRWAELPLEIAAASGEPLEQPALWRAAFVRHGRPLYAYWLPAPLTADPPPPRPVRLTLPPARGATLDRPVLVDPLTAIVYRLPRATRAAAGWQIEQAPLADYPLIVSEQSLAIPDTVETER
jgi:hypothetical protein